MKRKDSVVDEVEDVADEVTKLDLEEEEEDFIAALPDSTA